MMSPPHQYRFGCVGSKSGTVEVFELVVISRSGVVYISQLYCDQILQPRKTQRGNVLNRNIRRMTER